MISLQKYVSYSLEWIKGKPRYTDVTSAFFHPYRCLWCFGLSANYWPWNNCSWKVRLSLTGLKFWALRYMYNPGSKQCPSLRFSSVCGVCHNSRAREFITGLSMKAKCSQLNFFVWNNVHLKPGGQNCFLSQSSCPVSGPSCSFQVLQYFLLSFLSHYIHVNLRISILTLTVKLPFISCYFTSSLSTFLFYFPLFDLTATRIQHWMLYNCNNSNSCWSSNYWFWPTHLLVTRHYFAIH